MILSFENGMINIRLVKLTIEWTNDSRKSIKQRIEAAVKSTTNNYALTLEGGGGANGLVPLAETI